MIIKKVKEIKNSDAFDSFNWDGRDLCRYNLIYGWNGSGKTTISRIFNFLERKQIHIPELSNIQFSIQADSINIKESDLVNNETNIRVFNEDFIKENLSFDASQAKKIIIFGKENIEIQKEIDMLEGDLQSKQLLVNELQEKIKSLPKLDDILYKAGSEIPKQFANTPLSKDVYSGRNYNRSKVFKRLENGDITEANVESKVISSLEDINSKINIIKNNVSKITFIIAPLNNFSDLYTTANLIIQKNLEINDDQKFEDLKKDGRLRGWVEEGYKIHKDGEDICRFCNNQLPDDLIIKLGNFFTDELEKVKNQINSLESVTFSNFQLDFDSSVLFAEQIKLYIEYKEELKSEVEIVKAEINNLISELKTKKENLHEITKNFVVFEYPKKHTERINTLSSDLNELFHQHNLRVEKISEEISGAAQSIELHFISSILISNQYFKIEKESEKLKNDLDKLISENKKINEKIKSKKSSLLNISAAIERINEILNDYFGSDHIYLEISSSLVNETGYVLKRRDKEAKYLSEGEKSVLALIYFLIKLEEEGCCKSTALIIIDDPVDSQDSLFLFRTAGLLKRQLNSVGQLVILTHNFEFFNLMRDWLSTKQLKDNSELLLINHDKDNRRVTVEDLPLLLKNFKSEYQYLFSRLYLYSKNIKDLDEPLVANIARKILEYFAAFKWSCRTNDEFANIVHNRFIADPSRLKKGIGDFIVKFLHEYSHGQDFTREITSSMLESKPISKNVLEFIRLADNEHYDELERLCLSSAQIQPEELISNGK